jgi:hypothetical protein
MKKLLLLNLILGVYLDSYSQTNVYHKFPTDNAVWREYSYDYLPESSAHSCNDYQNIIDGDTIVGSYTYHIIRSFGLSYVYPYCGYPANMYTPIFFNNYYGAFREDTVSRKIFFLPPGSTNDTLLYDFNLNLGDTLALSYINNPTFTGINTVTSIDSILIGTEYHKRFEISAYNWGGNFSPYVYLIEGIGSTFGLVAQLKPEPEVPSGSTLLCFKVNGSTAYPDINYQCDIVTSIKENEIQTRNIIQISPNPFNLTTEIFLDKAFKSITIDIYNSQGEIVNRKIFSNRDKIEIDRIGLRCGLYLCKITLDNNIIVKKVVVND